MYRKGPAVFKADPDSHPLVTMAPQNSLLPDRHEGSLDKTGVAPRENQGDHDKNTHGLEPPIGKERGKEKENEDEG